MSVSFTQCCADFFVSSLFPHLFLCCSVCCCFSFYLFNLIYSSNLFTLQLTVVLQAYQPRSQGSLLPALLRRSAVGRVGENPGNEVARARERLDQGVKSN